ncbi:rubrerythrin-like domain-containing protein [Halostagnicola sp. A-GB9-2]|nr:rubrerythrin-like domain-containing protein [Halostagnicola sp. A-GB9-2]MDJ1433876.1 rubrerythrin-like domain-containing protein [Halostagnicola sp. A-GB9-2]
MKDVTTDPDEESTYECFACGAVARATSPIDCPECGAEMRNREIPIE